MNIGFDAKRIFHNKTGLGNYSRDIIRLLSTYYPLNHYFLYNPKVSKNVLFPIEKPNVIEKVPKSILNKFFYNLWRQINVVKDLKKDNVTLFHGLSGEIPIGLSQSRIKSVVTIHDLIFMRFPHYFAYLDRIIYFRKFKYAAKNADLVIAISEQTKQDIIHYLRIDARKIRVVYQGCQDVFKKQYTAKQKEDIITKFNLPEKFILNVGTIEPRKNLLTLVKAMEHVETHLLVVGSAKSSYAKEVKEYIISNRLENKITFLKGISNQELAILYQLADIFVYPSLFEGFGIPIIEALYSKTPVITTQNGCFKEAGGPDSIYLKDPEDTMELVDKIEKILLKEDMRKEIATEGFSFVQKFNDDVIANKLMDVYQEILS